MDSDIIADTLVCHYIDNMIKSYSSNTHDKTYQLLHLPSTRSYLYNRLMSSIEKIRVSFSESVSLFDNYLKLNSQIDNSSLQNTDPNGYIYIETGNKDHVIFLNSPIMSIQYNSKLFPRGIKRLIYDRDPNLLTIFDINNIYHYNDNMLKPLFERDV